MPLLDEPAVHHHLAQYLCRVVELLGFRVVEGELNDVADAIAVDHGRGADVDVIEAVVSLQQGADRQHNILVAQDSAGDAGQATADAVGRGALGLDDLVGRITGFLEDGVHVGGCIRVVLRGFLELLRQGNTSHAASGNDRQFRVAVLADDVGVDGGGAHVEVLAE